MHEMAPFTGNFRQKSAHNKGTDISDKQPKRLLINNKMFPIKLEMIHYKCRIKMDIYPLLPSFL